MDDPAEAALAHAAELYGSGRLAEAEAHYRRILTAQPDHYAALANLASVLHDLGRYEEAVGALAAAIQREPGRIETQRNLIQCLADWGLHVQRQGRVADAIALYRKALLLDGARAATHNNLGAALLEQGDVATAIESFRSAAQIDPQPAIHHFNLGNALRRAGALDAAIACYRAALEREPAHVDATINLGSALLDQGARDDAIALYRRAVALAPTLPSAHSNLLLALAYDPAQSASALRDVAEASGRALMRATPAVPRAPDRNRADDPGRCLRIGLISADFRLHPIGWFIQAPLRHADRRTIEFVCYADVAAPDPMTEQLRRLADDWRTIHGLSDEALAAQVAVDRIDILIDLAGHSAHNRLPALAHRLAPLQASWIGFPMTTGLATIDHLIADPRLAPPGSEAAFTETLVRLPEVAWCYTAPTFAPAVGPARHGPITFGSFNNPVKLNPDVLADWATILARVPDSRLLLKFRYLDGGDAAARLRGAAVAAGIAPERLVLAGASPHDAALAAYADVDIALDPFPFNGGTTTCEALWMGVPVVTFAGATMAGRMGASLITAAGLPELVAHDRAGAIEIAVALAGDRARLAGLRGSLRDRMAAAPLCDGPRFARHFEAALRAIWRHHVTG